MAEEIYAPKNRLRKRWPVGVRIFERVKLNSLLFANKHCNLFDTQNQTGVFKQREPLSFRGGGGDMANACFRPGRLNRSDVS